MSDRSLYDGLAHAIRAKETTPPTAAVEASSITANAGLAVYRNNARSSLSKALAEIFPVVHALVGEAFFKFAAREYFDAHPPSSPLVARYGDAFPAFLETFEPATSTPYLPDMARFELAWLDSYRAGEAEPLDREAVLTKAGDDPAMLLLTLHPSVQLLASDYPVASIWQRHQNEALNDRIDASSGENVLIARPRQNVEIHIVSAATYAFIEAITKGVLIADAFVVASDNSEHFDPQEIFQTIFSTDIIIDAARTK